MPHEFLDLERCDELTEIELGRPRRFVHGVLFLILSLLCGAVIWSACTRVDQRVKARARVRPLNSSLTDFTAVGGEASATAAGGKVTAVHFREGQEVHAGELLLELDAQGIDSDLAQLRRSLEADREELDRLKKLLGTLAAEAEPIRRKAEADLRVVRGQVERAVALRDRNRVLHADGIVPRAEMADAEIGAQEAEARLEQIQRTLECDLHDLRRRREEIEIRISAKQGTIGSSEERGKRLDREREEHAVRSRIRGIVTQTRVAVGDILEPGKPFAVIAPPDGFRIDATVATGDIAGVRVGMKARIKVDAFDHQRYGTIEGTIYAISPDAQVVETAQGAGSFYLVRIRPESPEVGSGSLKGRLQFGMSAEVEILRGEETLLSVLFHRFRREVSVD